MNPPKLVIMAAGMGSRYGGLKQIQPIDNEGDIILDFSLYDAMLAGFKDIIFIIKKEHEEYFRKLIDEKAGKYLNIEYAFQDINDIPAEFSTPQNRTKPWGTCHAVMSARKLINCPFCVINADDFYGRDSFKSMYDFLSNLDIKETSNYAMIGYYLKNTITENGTVSRGICTIKNDYLTNIVERTKIMQFGNDIKYEEKNNWHQLDKNTIVSMNFWGFTSSFMNEMIKEFPNFLDKIFNDENIDETKAEFYLPSIVDKLLKEDKINVKVIESKDKWYGITYKEDTKIISEAVSKIKENGLYPKNLWD